MPLHRRTVLAVALAVVLALTACAPTVTQGSLVGHSVPDAHLDVKGGTTSSFDTFAQNALSDITQFWTKQFPKVSGGKAFTELKGGFYSVDGRQVLISKQATAPATDNACIARQNTAIVDNAFYCRLDDSIAWDRSPTHLLSKLADKYGSLLVGLIFAHEYGHSISNRLGVFDDPPPTVYTESQADCAAGAWAASALKGDDPHFTKVTPQALDDALEGYLNARDDTPISSQQISHGNGFDRLSAIADGLDKGVTYCFSSGYFKSRTFTERAYYAGETEQDNTPLDKMTELGGANIFVSDLNRFWKQAAAGSSGSKTFAAVALKQAGQPPCAASGVQFGYCADDNTTYFDTGFARKAYYSLPTISADSTTGDVTISDDQPADFALGVLYSIAWGMAVRHQLFGRTLDGKEALLAAICYSGSYAKNINVPPTNSTTGPLITLSPADLDEAVSAMLDQVGQQAAFGARSTTGLDRIQAFVKGYAGGLSVC